MCARQEVGLALCFSLAKGALTLQCKSVNTAPFWGVDVGRSSVIVPKAAGVVPVVGARPTAQKGFGVGTTRQGFCSIYHCLYTIL